MFCGIVKFNTHEKFKYHKFAKLSTREMLMFSITKLTTCEIDYLQGVEHLDDLT